MIEISKKYVIIQTQKGVCDYEQGKKKRII